MTVPRLAPGSTVFVVGPDTTYVMRGLETSGDTAKLLLRTEDGRDWVDSHPSTVPAEPQVDRRVDAEARQFYAADPDPQSLAAARVGIEHITHHGQPLRWVGSSYPADAVEHRFACHDRACPFRLTWGTTS